uniref:Uncharacterized protein n=1 Tax=Mycena chlorophos TaxID=658473 RepID=A0ABQ0KW04_MYCCL|nr:predicted protein [Mycena chlorophos]
MPTRCCHSVADITFLVLNHHHHLTAPSVFRTPAAESTLGPSVAPIYARHRPPPCLAKLFNPTPPQLFVWPFHSTPRTRSKRPKSASGPRLASTETALRTPVSTRSSSRPVFFVIRPRGERQNAGTNARLRRQPFPLSLLRSALGGPLLRYSRRINPTTSRHFRAFAPRRAAPRPSPTSAGMFGIHEIITRRSEEFAPRRAANSQDFNAALTASRRLALERCSEDFAPRRAAISWDFKLQCCVDGWSPSSPRPMLQGFCPAASGAELGLQSCVDGGPPSRPFFFCSSIPRIPPRASQRQSTRLDHSWPGVPSRSCRVPEAKTLFRLILRHSSHPRAQAQAHLHGGVLRTLRMQVCSEYSAMTRHLAEPPTCQDRARLTSAIPAVVTIPGRLNRLSCLSELLTNKLRLHARVFPTLGAHDAALKELDQVWAKLSWKAPELLIDAAPNCQHTRECWGCTPHLPTRPHSEARRLGTMRHQRHQMVKCVLFAAFLTPKGLDFSKVFTAGGQSVAGLRST